MNAPQQNTPRTMKGYFGNSSIVACQRVLNVHLIIPGVRSISSPSPRCAGEANLQLPCTRHDLHSSHLHAHSITHSRRPSFVDGARDWNCTVIAHLVFWNMGLIAQGHWHHCEDRARVSLLCITPIIRCSTKNRVV